MYLATPTFDMHSRVANIPVDPFPSLLTFLRVSFPTPATLHPFPPLSSPPFYYSWPTHVTCITSMLHTLIHSCMMKAPIEEPKHSFCKTLLAREAVQKVHIYSGTHGKSRRILKIATKCDITSNHHNTLDCTKWPLKTSPLAWMNSACRDAARKP